jgi:PIN domain nuclease of toxin-antitoxin system
MDLLIDTHTFLWAIDNSPRLSQRAGELIANPTNNIFLSIASVWEIAVKMNIGKLSFRQPFESEMQDLLIQNNINLVPVKIEHTAVLTNLPLYHRDPFDRMMIAQAMVENFYIVSADSVFGSYPGLIRAW